MAIEVSIKKWGNSMGIILPKELVKEKDLKENETILIEVVKKADLRHLFGSYRTKMTGQEFKDEVKKGWH
jgi:antitoxin component of MazEF toxin-antitoxin module